MSQNKTEMSVFYFLPPPLVRVNVFNDGRFSSFFMLIGGLEWGLCIEMHVLCKAQELGFWLTMDYQRMDLDV